MNGQDLDSDVAIIGGGVSGMTLAAVLGQFGIRTILVDAAEPRAFDATGDYDIRTLAITRASERIFRHVGAWQHIETGRLGCFRKMYVWDANGHGSIHFDSADICEPVLGYIIENRVIIDALDEVLKGLETVIKYRPASLESAVWQDDRVNMRLGDGRRLSTKLLVGADGANSPVRQMAGIESTIKDYGQQALVCWIRTAEAHQDIARQRFLGTGPLAFLPLDRQDYCSIVWSTTPEEADSLKTMQKEDFHRVLEEAFAGELGAIVDSGPRALFALQGAHAEHYAQSRLALIGDAAHRVHPLAGQGANLGLLDAAALGEVLAGHFNKGGDPGDRRVLRRYERWRKGDNLAVKLLMEGFKELFGSKLQPLRLIRNAGLDIADGAPPLKRFIMRRAMGLEGDLPRIALEPRSTIP